MKLFRSLAALLCLMPVMAWAQGAKSPPGVTTNSAASLKSLVLTPSNCSGANNTTHETLTGVAGFNLSGVCDGTSTVPATTTNPSGWIQRFVRRDLGSEFAQTVDGFYVESNAQGSGTTTPIRGARMGGLFSQNCLGINQGTSAAPNFDYNGDCIGLAGFAASSGALYNGHITTGMWAWGKGPTLDATTYANLPAANWSTVGSEINVSYNHPDPGVQPVLAGKGTTVGQLINNYRSPGAGVADLTFGQYYSGVPNDGSYASTDVTNYSGYHTAAFWNVIKNYGLRFGTLMANGSYGIYFPDAFAGSQAPAAGIYMGGAKLNIGTYTGATFNEGDIWHNGDRLYYAHTIGGTSVNERFLTDRAGVTTLSATHTFSLNGGFGLQMSTVGSAVNYSILTNAATGSGPTMSAAGSDAAIPYTIAAKGSAPILLTGSALQFAQSMPLTVNGGFVARMNTVANAVNFFDFINGAAGGYPALVAAGSDTNSGLELRPKGTGTIFISGGGAKKIEAGSAGVGFNGASPTGKCTLPAALPTDGTASNAAIAAGYNAIRSCLVTIGLGQ